MFSLINDCKGKKKKKDYLFLSREIRGKNKINLPLFIRLPFSFKVGIRDVEYLIKIEMSSLR